MSGMADDRRCWCGMPAATTHVHAGADPAASGTFPASGVGNVRPMPDPYEEAKRRASTVVTEDMRQAVRREECMTRGHSFTEIVKFSSLAPQRILCNNCGSSWRVHPDDIERNY